MSESLNKKEEELRNFTNWRFWLAKFDQWLRENGIQPMRVVPGSVEPVDPDALAALAGAYVASEPRLPVLDNVVVETDPKVLEERRKAFMNDYDAKMAVEQAHPSYNVFWSDEDQAYVGTCGAAPWLFCRDKDPRKAFESIVGLVEEQEG